jgi:molybdopterin synthase catalytic subunit
VDDLWVGLELIDLDALTATLADDSMGGVAVFLGRVRSPNGGQTVHYLEYEGYDEMILAVMGEIAAELRAAHGDLRVAIHHRLGRLEPGVVSLALAVAAPHRAAALSACAQGVEAVKLRLPVWKLEVGSNGSSYVTGSARASEVL